MKIILFLILAVSASSAFAQSKNKDSSLERAIRDEIADEISGDDNKNNKGGGKPSDPGAHGRANAESKSGGGGKHSDSDSLLGDILNEIDEDDREDHKGGKNKGGKGGK